MTTQICRACDTSLAAIEIGTYQFCRKCGSANYVSDKSAEVENMAYFEENAKSPAPQSRIGRSAAYYRFERLHRRLHSRQMRRFEITLGEIRSRLAQTGKLVEVGFGGGAELAGFLQDGIDAYGLDLSENTVANFQQTYPQWSERVSVGTFPQMQVGGLYSNALFEHLDQPGHFLDNAQRILSRNGVLVIRLPMIEYAWLARRQVDADIVFWMPCHRVLYTRQGLALLLQRHGFKVQAAAGFSYFGWNVMSRMLAHGFTEVEGFRTPFADINGLSDARFNRLLLEALITPVSSRDYVVMAVPT